MGSLAKSSIGSRLFDNFNYVLMFLLTLSFLYPFWYIVAVSLNDSSVASYQEVWIWPKSVTLQNYAAVFADNQILSGYRITILRAIIGSIAAVLGNSLVAYMLSKKHLIGRKYFLMIITITMFFGGGLIPTYLLYKKLGLLNHFAVYIIPGILGAWTIMIMKTYFLSNVPASLEESAKMDGANELYIFFKVALPLSLPMIATISLFAVVGAWNDWWSGEVLVKDKALKPVQTVLMKIIMKTEALESMKKIMARSGGKSAMAAVSIKMAAVIVVTLPVLVAYPFCQKYFVNGIMIGSIKE